ncbi:hypothetical protein GCM10027405_29470 [Arthrobacter alkaliphilus]
MTSTGPGPVGADRTWFAAFRRTVRLSGVLDSLENRLGKGADGQPEFLNFLWPLDEINYRVCAAGEWRTRAANFESDGRIGNFHSPATLQFSVNAVFPQGKRSLTGGFAQDSQCGQITREFVC